MNARILVVDDEPDIRVLLKDILEDEGYQVDVAEHARAANEIRKIAEVEQCHMIAGGFDYLLKVRTSDMADYRALLGEKISSLPGVTHTSTFVVMEAVKDFAA